jgi:diguanylate cyclase (GGDEF)-like protein
MADAVRVLLVEDDEDDYLLTRDMLADCGAGFTVDWVNTRVAGLERLREGDYDVALVDYRLGKETGVDLLRDACARVCRTPVIMLTGENNRETDLEAMHAGAADYLVKGRVTGDLLERAIRYARERHRLLEQIRSMSLTDELTGLANRRGFLTLADQRLQLLQRRAAWCLIVYADVDGLKAANDIRGHESGDRLLIDTAQALRATFRGTDLLARMGGDEFVVLADEADEAEIGSILARLEERIAERNDARPADEPALSISTGAIGFRASAKTDLPQLLSDADARMMQCKQGRRTRAATPIAVDLPRVLATRKQ